MLGTKSAFVTSVLAVAGRFGRDAGAATGIEYALIIGGISIAILATVFALGAELNHVFESIHAVLDECAGSGTASEQGLSHGQGSGCGQQ